MNVLADKIIIFRAIGKTFKNCGGASGAQNSSLASDQAFQKTMTSNYQTEFGQSEALFNNLTQGLQAITQAGPSQQGFSPAELAAKNSQNINAAAASNQKIQTAIGENAAGQGVSGAPGVESGIVQAERAQAATDVDTAMNNRAADITQQNYETGRQNYWKATQGTEAAPGAFFDPLSQTAGQVTNAGKATSDQANAVQQANEQGLMSTIGMATGLAGDVAGAF